MGAWIETGNLNKTNRDFQVAPRVGAWIETRAAAGRDLEQGSRPAWARGLKLLLTLVKYSPV